MSNGTTNSSSSTQDAMPDLAPAFAAARDTIAAEYASLSDIDAVRLYRREIVTVIPDALIQLPDFSPAVLRELTAHEDAALERKNWETLLAILSTLEVMDEMVNAPPSDSELQH